MISIFAVKPSFGFGDLDEEALDPSLAVLGCGPRGSPGSQGERIERFSRKVFVGGLPPDIDEGMLPQEMEENPVFGIKEMRDNCIWSRERMR